MKWHIRIFGNQIHYEKSAYFRKTKTESGTLVLSYI